MTLSHEAFTEVRWWAKNINEVFRPIKTPKVDLVIYSDASLEGWGGGCYNTSSIGGRWSESELPSHINTLELQAAKLTVQVYASFRTNVQG